MNTNRFLLLFQIPVWVTAIFFAWFFSSDEFPGMQPSYVVSSTLILSIWMLGSFYVFYSYLVPKYKSDGNIVRFWLYAIIFVMVLMPVAGITLLLLTNTSALTLSQMLSPEGLLPYLGGVAITLVCSWLGALYRLLLKRYKRENLAFPQAG